MSRGVILLMMAYFGERQDSLLLLADITDPIAEVAEDLQNIHTPRLVMQGQSILTAVRWTVCIDGKVCCTSDDFTVGLSFLFASYYVFNLEYQAEAATTLEFIQRCLMRINPDTGNKSAGRVKSRTGHVVQRKRELIYSHVVTFVRKLADFEWT